PSSKGRDHVSHRSLVRLRRPVQPVGVPRRLLGFAPFAQHVRGDAGQLGILLFGADIAGQLDTVAIGVEEVDRLEYAVEGRPQHLDAHLFQMGFRGQQVFLAPNLEGDMLHPGRGVCVAAHILLVRQFEEGEDIAAAGIEEDVHVGIVFAGRGYMVLGEGGGVLHAEGALVEFYRFAGILAAIGRVMDAAEGEGMAHCLSPAAITPRSSWSRSIDSNRALKFPSPKPSSFLRWMNSKNTGPIRGCANICSSSLGSPSSVEPSSNMPRFFSSSTGSPCPGSRSSSIS